MGSAQHGDLVPQHEQLTCAQHGVVVTAVPWARARSRFTATFEDQAAWLCAAMIGAKAALLLRTTWRSLQPERVVTDLAGKTGRLDGLCKIGIDEISYRKRRFLMVVDHGTGRLVWARRGPQRPHRARLLRCARRRPRRPAGRATAAMVHGEASTPNISPSARRSRRATAASGLPLPDWPHRTA